MQLAKKRKTLLDEMAIKGQESVGEQLKKVEEMEARYKVRRWTNECMEGGVELVVKYTCRWRDAG